MPLYLGDKLVSGRSRPIDAEPIENSLNLVASGGVKKYVDDKLASGTISGSGIAIQPEEPTDTDVWIDLDDDEIEELSVVTSFNGRDGEVVPEIGDYTAEMVGADPSGSAASALTSAMAYTDSKVPIKTSQLTNDSGFITNPVESDLIINGSVEVATPSTFHDDVVVEGTLWTTDEEYSYIHSGSILGYAAPATLVSTEYTIITLEELYSTLNTVISGMSNRTVKYIVVYFDKAFAPFNGGTWLMKIYRSAATYVQVTAECYAKTANGSSTVFYNSTDAGLWQEWSKGLNSGNFMNYAAALSHNQAASTITAGTFAGQVVANSSAQTYDTYLLRNTRLASSDTTPTVNGQINWTYG